MVAFLLLFGISTFAQPQFTDVKATVEGAIKLYWESEPGGVYQVDYADELVDVNVGGTVWHPLVIDYPSHGTNTFIADAGNYDVVPEILHPKLLPQRFYRVTYVEANTSVTNPVVSIASPTNDASLVGEITVTVAAASDEILTAVKLYIDGEEQWSSEDGANFVINTCEWPNGPHTIFATAKAQSGLEGVANGEAITYGRAVSAYVNVTFDNLITRFDFSEPFFEPDLEQTQRVSAVFAANCDWALEIQDAASNTVRYVSGSGATMQFDWDGTGTNGASLPDGVYSYLLTATTNGQSLLLGGGGAASLSAASLSDTPRLWAMQDSGRSVPLALYPPGYDTNHLNLFEAAPAEVFALNQALGQLARPATTATALTMETDRNGLAAATHPGEWHTRAPKRKPKVGVKGKVGTFGILYKTYTTASFSVPHPPTGWPFPLQTLVAIDGQSPTAQTVDRGIWTYPGIAKDFKEGMTKAGWRAKFVKENDAWNASDIRKPSLGGRSIFNGCNFGLLMTHGSAANNNNQGNSSDGVKYSYILLLDLASNKETWVRLSDLDLGSPGTGGLRWMTIHACSVLKPENITSMKNNNKLPINEDLHLLMGGGTTIHACPAIGRLYASNLVADVPIPEAWYNTGKGAYQLAHGGVTNIVTYRTIGWTACFNDTLSLYNDPDGTLDENSRNVFEP